jgi:hypothetical protein
VVGIQQAHITCGLACWQDTQWRRPGGRSKVECACGVRSGKMHGSAAVRAAGRQDITTPVHLACILGGWCVAQHTCTPQHTPCCNTCTRRGVQTRACLQHQELHGPRKGANPAWLSLFLLKCQLGPSNSP